MSMHATLTAPPPLLAHGLQGHADLPIPIVAFYWVAAVVLVVSFVALGALWHRPLLADLLARRCRPAPGWLERARRSPLTLGLVRALVLATFALIVAAALFGSTAVISNIAPPLVFCTWFVGLVPLAVLTGNSWREIAPWTTLAVLLAAPRERTDRALPTAVGIWLALPGLVVFAWLELVYPTAAHVRLLGWLIVAYTVLTLVAMLRYGLDTWLDRGETWSVYSGLLARLSPWALRNGQLQVRPLALGTLEVRPAAGLAPFVTSMIGSVSFDGLSRTPWWSRHAAQAALRLADVGFGPAWARDTVWTLGLVTILVLAWGLFELAALAADLLGDLAPRVRGGGRVADALVPSLVPIALAYAVAHYFSFYVFQNQDLVRLASDPFGQGWNLFGTNGFDVNFSAVSANAIWIVQVVAIVVGHVTALALAHDRTLELIDSGRGGRRAALAQLPTLLLMVLLSVAGLFFLSGGMVR